MSIQHAIILDLKLDNLKQVDEMVDRIEGLCLLPQFDSVKGLFYGGFWAIHIVTNDIQRVLNELRADGFDV